ncbi:MAG: TolC family protein [Holophagales bacterium]|nr:TolC family protein [Holophagales bacterium]MYD23907.1 TolC family protein [Holophagales bacterium]MYI34556.1 TolC family protein [Holophagales bacterium]
MHRFTLVGLLGGFFAVAGAAQDRAVVTEAEFLSVLDETHPAVRESAGAVGLAEARLVAARTLDNPVVEAVREDPAGPIGQTDVLVSWQIPDVARRPEIEAREGAVGAARRRLTYDLLGYRLAMREAYADWAVAAARRQRLALQAERVESLAQREVVRAERGEASGLEARRLGLAAATLRSRVALAAGASERARAEAAAWHPGLPADALPVLPELPDAPSLDGADVRVRAAEADLAAAELAQLATRPIVASPEVTVGWRRQDLTPGAVDGPIFGVAWSVPLFDRRQAARQSAGAGLEAARARLELAERESTAARNAARSNFARLSAALAEAREELGATERMLDGADAAFRQGEAGLTDLLETHRSVTEAELAVLDLHEAALAAHRELERLAASREGGPGS